MRNRIRLVPAIVRAAGGRVEIVSFVEGHSTTDLIATIRERYCGSPAPR